MTYQEEKELRNLIEGALSKKIKELDPDFCGFVDFTLSFPCGGSMCADGRYVTNNPSCDGCLVNFTLNAFGLETWYKQATKFN